MFDTEEFIIAVFYCIDDFLAEIAQDYPPRKRGFALSLTDSEVITMEIVGEWNGFDRDKEIWRYFKAHWSNLFPLITSRSTFVRQELQEQLLSHSINLQTAKRSNTSEKRSRNLIHLLSRCQRLIETVIGQLSERFNFENVRARDLWHLTSRINRKVLAHTVCFWLNRHSLDPLQFEQLLIE